MSSDFQIFPCVLLHSFLHNNGILELASGLGCVFFGLAKTLCKLLQEMVFNLCCCKRENKRNPKEDTQCLKKKSLLQLGEKEIAKKGLVGGGTQLSHEPQQPVIVWGQSSKS